MRLLLLILTTGLISACGPAPELDAGTQTDGGDVVADAGTIEYTVPQPNVMVSNAEFGGDLFGYEAEYGPAEIIETVPFGTYYGGWFYVRFTRPEPSAGDLVLRMQFSAPGTMAAGTVLTGRDRTQGYLLTRGTSGPDLDNQNYGELAGPQRIEFQDGPEEGTFLVLFDLDFPGAGNNINGQLLISNCDIVNCP